MPVRLKDVAARAGVSVKTASNVVNDYDHIRPETRERVRRAIADLGYRPNLSARKLKYGKSGFLALALPQMDSPYFAELAARISARATDLGYIVLLDVTGASPEAERLVLAGMSSHIIDGVIFSPLALSNREIADRSDEVPMVLLGERASSATLDHVSVDSVAASRAITEHLLAGGRQRVAAIGWESAVGTASVRLEGYRSALQHAGLEVQEEMVRGVTEYARAAGKRAMEELLALPSPPDAVFCFNDLMAIGALRACHEAGVRVPDDIAVAGFDDIAEGAFYTPTLTTISPDLEFLADRALRLLTARIDGGTADAELVSVPWQLVVRESTGGAG